MVLSKRRATEDDIQETARRLITLLGAERLKECLDDLEDIHEDGYGELTITIHDHRVVVLRTKTYK
ncbi:MAG: hypothetical protein ACOYYS_10185 [Chloroflexota bacterium]